MHPGKLAWTIRLIIVTAVMPLAITLNGCGWLYDWVGGHFAGPPGELRTSLSAGARQLISAAYRGIDPEQLADLHVHLVGDQTGGNGAVITPSAKSWRYPTRRVQFQIYLSAAGVEDPAQLDVQYVARLVDLIRNSEVHGRYFLYAMDRHYRPDGTPDPEQTPFYVPNDYVFFLARQYPEFFVPVISIHPYRADALAELDSWAQRGLRYVKWLPNSMGIDPGSDLAEPFYRKLLEHNMVLLVHTGRELAVPAREHQQLGNPLRLRKPLDMGVTVVALHSASDGHSVDLDSPERPTVPSFDLFMRLMNEPQYDRLLFGEISAVTFFNHLSRPLETLLDREDLHHRLVNGSDYPLPGINLLIMTRQLARLGLITAAERSYLNEIYGFNPLLFDFVVKRTLRHPTTGKRFPATVFMLPAALRTE